MTVGLSDVVQPEEAITAAIDAAVEAAHEEEERTYLGASVIGDPCERKIWYAFRWADEPERFSGRMLRLFETGHVEEARMVEWLRAAGVDVVDRSPETGEQLAISEIGGHFRGHLDGEATGVPTASVVVHVVEFKTHNAKSFASLKRHGVEASKPAHAAQMQVYMDRRGRTRALYVAECKDNSELYAERVRHDPEQAMRLLAKAERIITSDNAPPRIKDDPAAFPCLFCARADLCHRGKWARRNCRTCCHACVVLDGNGGWRCEKHNVSLSTEAQRIGCPQHLYLPDLVPGEITDIDESVETVTYQLASGEAWVDGVEAA